MHETRNASDVINLLESSYPRALAGIIGIDGIDGSGKTTLANALRDLTGGQVVTLDKFVVKNRGGYFPYLRLPELKAALAAHNQPIIVEGVCLLEALAAISVIPDVLIYIKRVSDHGEWYDEETCDPEEPEEELVRRLSAEVAAFVNVDGELSGDSAADQALDRLTPFREEMVRYHWRFRPSRRAQIVFLR